MKKYFGLLSHNKVQQRYGLVLFAVLIFIYIAFSEYQHIINPENKIFPTLLQLINGIKRAATPDNTGEIILLSDTIASMKRFIIGVSIGSISAICFGIALAVFPIIEALFLKITIFFSKIPLISAVPILFVLLGLGEEMKIFLIILGIFFFITLDIYERVKAIPQEQIIKGMISGANTWEIIYNIIFRQIAPAAITSIRMNLLSAWLFLISSEAFAADGGLGYRIFVVRRYMAMDIIIPYVLWIAILSFSIDALMSWWVKKEYPWYGK